MLYFEGGIRFRVIDNSSIAFHAFAMRMLTSLSVDEILLPRYMNLSSNFRDLLLKMEMALSTLTRFDLCLRGSQYCTAT